MNKVSTIFFTSSIRNSNDLKYSRTSVIKPPIFQTLHIKGQCKISACNRTPLFSNFGLEFFHSYQVFQTGFLLEIFRIHFLTQNFFTQIFLVIDTGDLTSNFTYKKIVDVNEEIILS